MPQVGRWHGSRRKSESNWEPRGFIEELSGFPETRYSNNQNSKLPEDLQYLNKEDFSEVIFFSDQQPYGLLDSLDNLRNVTKLGLVASSTPFVTGRPVTLFHNGTEYGHGAVGFAVMQSSKKQRAILGTDFAGLVPLSDPVVITKSYGNMIISLDYSDPTKFLTTAIDRSELNSISSARGRDGIQYMLGIMDGKQITQLYTITSNDTRRGSLSIDCKDAIKPGMKAQLFCCPVQSSPNVSLEPEPGANIINFLTSPEPWFLGEDHDDYGDSANIFSGKFLVASENGFHIGQGREKVWTCNIPGSSALLKWPAA